jgi:hypothetical protein
MSVLNRGSAFIAGEEFTRLHSPTFSGSTSPDTSARVAITRTGPGFELERLDSDPQCCVSSPRSEINIGGNPTVSSNPSQTSDRALGQGTVLGHTP